jgi:protein-S-isoprenylcysteine O-methyltransferase Ste14
MPASMNEAELHFALTVALVVLAVPTFAVLLWTTAPYGRHAREGWGPSIPSRLGWILMECPTVFFFLAVYLSGSHRFELTPLVLCAVWHLHYLHRTFVFPFRLRIGGKRMPLSVPFMGMTFNALNAYINARWISELGSYPASWLADPRFLVGLVVFLTGLAINLHADTVLIHLRKPGESGYKIPKGGMYRFITSPNYFGEIVEWIGWALMTWSLPGLAFAIYTIANLAPRALSNHRWYQEKFPDYPRERRALIPFVR